MRGFLIGSFKLMLGASVAMLSSPAVAVEHVDLKLVLTTDVSGSISNDELWLERRGTAAAFLYPDVIRAIEGGALGRIAVAMIDFSSPGFGKTVIDWRIIRSGSVSPARFSSSGSSEAGTMPGMCGLDGGTPRRSGGVAAGGRAPGNSGQCSAFWVRLARSQHVSDTVPVHGP